MGNNGTNSRGMRRKLVRGCCLGRPGGYVERRVVNSTPAEAAVSVSSKRSFFGHSPPPPKMPAPSV